MLTLPILLGYRVFETKEIVLDSKRIALRYIKTYFIFDFIGTVPFNTIVTNVFDYDNRTLQYFLALTRLARLARLKTMLQYGRQIITLWNLKEIAYDVFCLILVACYAVHWWACIVYLIPKYRYNLLNDPLYDSWISQAKILPDEGSLQGDQYLHSILIVSCHFYLAGSGAYQIEDTIDQALFTLVYLSGIVYFAYITAVVFELLSSASVSESKYEEIMSQLREYMISKKLPTALCHRMLMYYENKFQKHYFREHSILLTLSEHFRDELTVFCTKRLVDQVEVLKGLSKSLTGDLVARLKQEVYLPNDVVYLVGAPADAMYFIVNGTIAVSDMEGKEVCHYKDGDHFGEVAIVLKTARTTRQSTSVAIEITECLRLDKNDLWNLMSNNEEFTNRMTTVAREKYLRITDYYSRLNVEDAEPVSGRQGLLHDLRHGKIIGHRRPRPPLIKK